MCDSDEESDDDDNLELNALEKRAKTAATQQQNGEVDEEDRKDLLPVRTKQGWVQRYLYLLRTFRQPNIFPTIPVANF